MNFKVLTRPAEYKAIRAGDPDFTFRDGYTTVSRAGFEISPKCPDGYKDVLLTAVSNGWIRPVAYVKTKEYVWEQLTK